MELNEGFSGIPADEWQRNTAEAQEVQARQHMLARNFIDRIDPYLGGVVGDMELRPHQPAGLAEIKTIFGETIDTPDRRILWPAPPNFGKSFMASLVMRVAGVGEAVPDQPRPLKSLVMVPRDVARRQITETCKTVAPHLRLHSFMPSGDERIIDGVDTLLMTYKGCLDVPAEKWKYITDRVDLLVLDEVHRALGIQGAERLRRYMSSRKPTTLMLSATPDFSKDRRAADILNVQHVVPAMSPREAAMSGLANGVQLIALSSGQHLNIRSRRKAVTEVDVGPLLHNKPRNNLIAHVMADMATEGRQGLVQCLPGQKNAHAEIIAELARAHRIIDPKTGEERNLRVEAVGVHQFDSAKFVEAFKAGKLDALTFSKYLIEAFDHDGVRYVFAATPTASQVDMGQLVGRGARLGDPRVTKLLCLIDVYTSENHKQLQTPFHVFGTDHFYQGEIIASPEQTRSSSGQGQGRSGAEPTMTGLSPEGAQSDHYMSLYGKLSEPVMQAIMAIPEGTVLDEMLITKSVLTEPPEDYMLLSQVPVVQDGKATVNGASYALREQVGADGRPLSVVALGDRLRTFVSPEAVAFLQKRFDETGRISHPEIDGFLEAEGWPRTSSDGFLSLCEAANVEFTIVKRMLSLEAIQAYRLLRNMAETPLVDPEKEVLVADLARLLEHTNNSELLRVIRKITTYEAHLRERRRTRQPGAYQRVGAISLEGANMLLSHMIKRSTKRVLPLSVDEIPNALLRVQREQQEYMQARSLRPTLSLAAIAAFTGQKETSAASK